MRHGTFEYGLTQILTPASIVIYLGIETDERTVLVESDTIFGSEWVTLTGRDHVFISIEHASNWTTGLIGRDCHLSGEADRSALFATETATEPSYTGRHTVLRDTKRCKERASQLRCRLDVSN
jgi:hypothetical protein